MWLFRCHAKPNTGRKPTHGQNAPRRFSCVICRWVSSRPQTRCVFLMGIHIPRTYWADRVPPFYGRPWPYGNPYDTPTWDPDQIGSVAKDAPCKSTPSRPYICQRVLGAILHVKGTTKPPDGALRKNLASRKPYVEGIVTRYGVIAIPPPGCNITCALHGRRSFFARYLANPRGPALPELSRPTH